MNKIKNSEAIANIRKNSGLTRTQFAELLGCPRKTIENWEQGVRSPSDYIVKIIDYYVSHKLSENSH